MSTSATEKALGQALPAHRCTLAPSFPACCVASSGQRRRWRPAALAARSRRRGACCLRLAAPASPRRSPRRRSRRPCCALPAAACCCPPPSRRSTPQPLRLRCGRERAAPLLHSASSRAPATQGNPLAGLSPTATRRKQARAPLRLCAVLRGRSPPAASAEVAVPACTPFAAQVQSSLAYRAKQRGFLELDLLVARALPQPRLSFTSSRISLSPSSPGRLGGGAPADAERRGAGGFRRGA